MARTLPKFSGLLQMGTINTPSKEMLDKSAVPDTQGIMAGIKAGESVAHSEPPAAASTGKQMLPLNKLRPSPFNVRKIRTPERIEEIARSLQENGQREPITVYPGFGEDEGFLMVVSGLTRMMAAALIGWTELEARIDHTIDANDPLSIAHASHIHNDSAPETDLDHALIARELLHRFTQVQVAKALGYNGNRQISRFNAFFELPESILDLGKTAPRKFSASFAEILVSALEVIGEDAARNILATVIANDLSRADMERLIELEKRKRALNGSRRVRSTRMSTFEFKAAGTKVGAMHVLQTAPDKKQIKFDATLPPDIADRLSDELERFLRAFGAKAGTAGSDE